MKFTDFLPLPKTHKLKVLSNCKKSVTPLSLLMKNWRIRSWPERKGKRNSGIKRRFDITKRKIY